MADFLKGAAVGFSLAAPVGPVALVCIRRTAAGGRLLGFVSGLGAAVADTICGFIAAIGLSSLTAFLSAHRMVVQGVGGGTMLVIGAGILLDRGRNDEGGRQPLTGADLLPAFLSTLGLTLASPLTLAGCAGFLAAFGFGHGTGGIESVATLLAGIFTGSAAWWLILSAGVGWLGARLKPSLLTGINRVAGATLAVAGAVYLVSGLRR